MWTSTDIECSLSYEELNGFDHADKIPAWWVDGIDNLVCRDGAIDSEGLCFICYRPTYWLEISFEAHMCSPRCTEILWSQYWELNAKAGPISD